ncbi:hypothetical protein SAMN02745171_01689 [Porphyromonas circumdentaria]|uniref:Uncharacterized protein n=1 Tax=Porphyromonas circumdentaria TaxID=29524 RepID=A0A1T4Q3C2_9PORP|nr:hypothetical protein SAMN02745171_01689 [Porphyromonas circumdentaria]
MTEEVADPLQDPNSFPFVFSQLRNGNNLPRKQRLPTELGELLARPFRSLLYPRFLLFGATYPKKAGLIRLLIPFLFICFWFHISLFTKAFQPMRTK